MTFGIFHGQHLPRTWKPDNEWHVDHHAFEPLGLDVLLGHDDAAEIEHHGLQEYSHLPAPKGLLRTPGRCIRNIRRGHSILPLTTSHHSSVIERISVRDLLINGRVDIGMSESASFTKSMRV